MGDPDLQRPHAAIDLEQFARRLRNRHVRRAAAAAAMRTGLTLAVPAIALAWLLASWRWPVLATTAALTAFAALFAALRAQRVADTALLRLASGDEVDDPQLLAELSDELATWLESRAGSRSPMHAWLAADVRAKLPRLHSTTVAAIGRRRIGRRLWLLPLALLLLIAWFLTNLLSPPWAGVLGGRITRPDSSSGSGGSGAGGQGQGEGQAADAAPEPSAQKAPTPQAAVPPPAPAPNDPPATEPPAPMLDLPTQQHFVVPEFVGDGPTRRARMHAAEVEQGAPAGASSQSSGTPETRPLPPPAEQLFARAAEQALAARHVPPSEQPMVRRYFEALKKAAK